MMNPSNTTKITIPKPCHESWNQMTPNEQGAFCQKCCKTVIDFSAKSKEEIINTLKSKKKEKVCGRFANEQISQPLFSLKIPRNLLPSKIPMHKAFVLALFISFGSTLFSCSTHLGQTMGEVAIIDSIEIEQLQSQDTNEVKHLLGDTILIEEIQEPTIYEPKMGQVQVVPDTGYEEKEIKMGKVKIDE